MNKELEIFHINDVTQGFTFGNFFSLVSEGVTVENKGEDEMPF